MKGGNRSKAGRTLILRLCALGEDVDHEGRAIRPDDTNCLVNVVDRDDGHNRREDFSEDIVSDRQID